MARRRAFLALLVAAALTAGGCGHRPHSTRPSRSKLPASSTAGSAATSSPAPVKSAITTPAGAAASVLAPVLPLLRPAGPPLLLPSWLPAAGTGRSYYFTVQADSHTYSVDIATSPTPAAPNSLKGVPQADLLGAVRAGFPGALGPTPAYAKPVADGVAQPIAPGLVGTFYAQSANLFYSLLRWRTGGWVYEVVDTTGLGRDAKALLPYAHKLVAQVPGGRSPVPGGTAGTVVQALSPDNTAVWVLWNEGPWAYRVEGENASALHLSESLRAVVS